PRDLDGFGGGLGIVDEHQVEGQPLADPAGQLDVDRRTGLFGLWGPGLAAPAGGPPFGPGAPRPCRSRRSRCTARSTSPLSAAVVADSSPSLPRAMPAVCSGSVTRSHRASA